jgi:hypothetical protein
MNIVETIIKASLSIEQILVVYENDVSYRKYGYFGTIELTYLNGEIIELDHLKQTLAVYIDADDHFKVYHWWSGCQQWKEYSK